MTALQSIRHRTPWKASWPACLAAALCFQALGSGATAAENRPELRIDGGTAEQRQNIRAFLPMTRYTCELPEFRERGVIRSADDRVRQALRALGHYQPELELAIRRTEDCWNLELQLDPGPAAQIAEVDVQVTGEGAEDPAFVAIVTAPGIEVGDRLRHDHYDRLRSRLMRAAADRGYFDAELTASQLRVDPQTNEARVVLHLDTRARYRFGPITLEQDILRPEFVERLYPFETGAPYRSGQLIMLQRNLADSGYFESVRVRPRLDDAVDGEVPITAEVSTRKRTAYEARLGFSTDTGPRLGLAMDRRYANRRGHRYNAELEASTKRSGVGFNYDIPLRDPLREHLSLFATYRTEDTAGTRSDRAQLGASRVRQHASGWQTTEGIRYEYEEFTVGGVSDTTHMLMPSYRVNRTESDDPLFPRDGYRVELLGQGAHESLASSISFLQARGSAKFIRGLGAGRMILRGDAGLTYSDDVQEMPKSLRFFAGGDTSVRGFGFQKLGPQDDEGRMIGGRHLLVGSIEYDYPFGDGPWGAAVFLDAGNAFDSFDDYDLKLGFGAGLRWRSPVGPIRVDLAHAPDSPDSFRIHFTMGPDL
ncbi:autotransporter assembly complex protein TamA [Thioalkalivibrio paradoxus]|uniref:Translocation and assembly module subunit TamA n=1 Tax=Thioalkalivibrio paradoxus ARh 1 TaxID=713585 RepID=W0DLS1_9GAMM|nr:autotransporter assembly complex family protein [Thioalkalivibrio paradoxus]AHE99401.1 membrane protein [Thioalkalivibrio paradoxus ARh 1]